MRANRGGQVHEGVELLQLARTCDRQKSGDGDLAVVAARSEHDLPPLNGGPERALGRVVRRLDTLLVREGKEVREMQEQRARTGLARADRLADGVYAFSQGLVAAWSGVGFTSEDP